MTVLALNDQNSKPKSVVVLNDRIIEICAETFGDFWDWQRWQLSTQLTDFGVQGVAPVAAAYERLASLGVDWLGTCPDPEPGQAVCFREELMRIGDLRECWGAQNKRENNTDVADHVKTAERHDSLPRFAGAPLMFYNRARSLSRPKVVIAINGRAIRWTSSVRFLLTHMLLLGRGTCAKIARRPLH